MCIRDSAVTVLRNGKELSFALPDEAKKAILDSEGRFISPRYSNTIGAVGNESIASANGVLANDKIVAINGKPITHWVEFQNILKEAKGQKMLLTLDREGARVNKSIMVPVDEPLGVSPSQGELVVKDEYGFFAALPVAFTKTFDVLSKQVRQFKLIFNNKVQGYKKVKGPIGIVEMMSPTWDWQAFWAFTAMFSVWLAFVNILPIPALDGGHVMFLLYEMISGKAPSEKTLERGQIVGFVIVMGLMAVVFGNDIWNVIKRFL